MKLNNQCGALSYLELKKVLQRKHKLRKHTFTVEIKDPANANNRTIEVRGSVSGDILKMYFESKGVGSRRGAVETCSIVENGRALITFYDYEGTCEAGMDTGMDTIN